MLEAILSSGSHGDVEPLRVELLVERQVMGGEPRQLVGALDGVRVVRSRGSKPELVLTSTCQRAVRRHSGRSPGSHVSASRDERQPDGCAVRRHRRLGSGHEVVGVDDDRAVSPGVADGGVQLVQRLEPDVLDAHVADGCSNVA